VIQHPLNLADPQGHPRQFRREGIDLDPQQVLRPDGGKLPPQAQGLGLGDDLMLQVLQAQQGEQEKVPRPTGRVEDAELLQAMEKALIQLPGGILGLGGCGPSGHGSDHQKETKDHQVYPSLQDRGAAGGEGQSAHEQG
jgi:hypothetical protein